MAVRWQTLAIDLHIPRSETILKDLDLMRGLKTWKFFSVFSLFAAVMCLGGLLVPGAPIVLIFAAGFLGLVGVKFHKHVQTQHHWRRKSLLQGLPVTGSIIRQRKRINLFSHQPHQLMIAKFWLEQHEQSATGILWNADLLKNLPQGAQIIGLWLKDQNTIWLPFEIGLKLETETIVPQEHIIELEEQLEDAKN